MLLESPMKITQLQPREHTMLLELHMETVQLQPTELCYQHNLLPAAVPLSFRAQPQCIMYLMLLVIDVADAHDAHDSTVGCLVFPEMLI